MFLRPRFITFEGLDNCGKTTQIRKLSAYLSGRGIPHRVEREPGSTALGGALRRLLKDPVDVYRALNTAFAEHLDHTTLALDQPRTSEAEVFLFLAARAEFIDHIVLPTLHQGMSLLADRFSDSTEAYQGGGLFSHDIGMQKLIFHAHDILLGKEARPGLTARPDLTFFLDIPYETMLLRAGTEERDFIERRGKDYFDRVRAAYLYLTHERPDRMVLVDGTTSIDALFLRSILPPVHRLYGLEKTT